jgi:predicted permease
MQPRAGRAPAALAALMFVLTGVLGMAHEATTAHVRCAAHGELVDSDGVAAVVVGPASGTIASTIAGAPLLARGHGDEHCLLASAVRASRIAPRSPTLIAAIATVDTRATPPLDRAAPHAAGLYRIAPKTSPPA